MRWWWPFGPTAPAATPSIAPKPGASVPPPKSRWWWPFGKDARATDQHFREMLDEALLRQSDLDALTQRMKDERKRRRGDRKSRIPK